MEKKSKAMAALACAALLVLVGSGCVRCTMVHSTQQDPVEQSQEEGAADDAASAKDSLENLLGTKWTSKDGKATLSIMNDAFVERAAGEEKVTYWEPENVKADGDGFSESVWASDSITSAQTPSVVRVDATENGGMAITCDSFKISATYLIDAPEDVELTISGDIDYLATLAGVEKDGIVSCLQDFVRSRSPYAKTATWDGEVYIDANANKTSSTFTLDDPNGIIATIVIDGTSGKISAM